MSIKPFVALFFVAIMTGCASTRQFVPLPDQAKVIEDPAKARIYVVRPSLVGGAVSMTVSDGEKVIGWTGGKGYLCWERPPGEATIKSRAETEATLPLKTSAGSVYYLQQHIRPGIIIARNKLSLLSEQNGKKALTKCKQPRMQIK